MSIRGFEQEVSVKCDTRLPKRPEGVNGRAPNFNSPPACPEKQGLGESRALSAIQKRWPYVFLLFGVILSLAWAAMLVWMAAALLRRLF
jgi:hypothetical protein